MIRQYIEQQNTPEGQQGAPYIPALKDWALRGIWINNFLSIFKFSRNFITITAKITAILSVKNLTMS